jgi:hypothetical protein
MRRIAREGKNIIFRKGGGNKYCFWIKIETSVAKAAVGQAA